MAVGSLQRSYMNLSDRPIPSRTVRNHIKHTSIAYHGLSHFFYIFRPGRCACSRCCHQSESPVWNGLLNSMRFSVYPWVLNHCRTIWMTAQVDLVDRRADKPASTRAVPSPCWAGQPASRLACEPARRRAVLSPYWAGKHARRAWWWHAVLAAQYRNLHRKSDLRYSGC